MAWEIVEYQGIKYRRSEGIALVPVDGSQGVAIVMLKDDGLTLAGVTAVAQGNPGLHAEIDETINLTELAPGDPTPASASFTTLTPPSGTTPGLYRLNLALHKGTPGDDGASVLNPTSFGTPVAGRILVVKSDLEGFEFAPQKIGDRHLPVEIADYSGSGDFTLCPISVPANTYPFDWRPEVVGFAPITGSDAQVDLVARLGGETTGNIVAHCPGIAAPERLAFQAALPAGSGDTFDRVAANAAATVYIRTEMKSGGGNYAVSGAACKFTMRARPIP